MALSASPVWSARFRVCGPSPAFSLHGRLLSQAQSNQTLHSRSVKLHTVAQLGEHNKVKGQLSTLGKRLWEVAPDSIKHFPWKKAEEIVLLKLIFLGQDTVKWSLVTFFILSSISDVIFCISRNKELMIPIGLFVGCLIADFLKETSQEFFPNLEKTGLKRHLLGIGCFFVFVKFISTFISLQGQAFLLHVGNGGLMQILWLWKGLLERGDGQSEQNTSPSQETSLTPEANN